MLEKLVLKNAEIEDLKSWMTLVIKMRNSYPGLDTKEQLHGYEKTVIKNMNRKTALCVKDENKIIGFLIFSINAKCLSCLGVDPDYRKKGIASALIEEMLTRFQKEDTITLSTYRDNDEKGIASRPLYKKFGFVEAEEVMEFNYPHQKFVLNR